jgi:HK97 gp10 family phage protein
MARTAYTRAPIEGLAELRETLKGLSDDLQTVIITNAVRGAAKPVERYAKMLAPRRTGALEASIGTVVRKSKKGASAYALVGPLRGYYRGGKRVTRGASNAGAGSPAHYAHLVEYGHATAKGAKGTSLRKKTATVSGFVPPKPFMRPAAIMAAAATGAAMADGIRTGIEKAVRKHNKRVIKRGLA